MDGTNTLDDHKRIGTTDIQDGMTSIEVRELLDEMISIVHEEADNKAAMILGKNCAAKVDLTDRSEMFKMRHIGDVRLSEVKAHDLTAEKLQDQSQLGVFQIGKDAVDGMEAVTNQNCIQLSVVKESNDVETIGYSQLSAKVCADEAMLVLQHSPQNLSRKNSAEMEVMKPSDVKCDHKEIVPTTQKALVSEHPNNLNGPGNEPEVKNDVQNHRNSSCELAQMKPCNFPYNVMDKDSLVPDEKGTTQDRVALKVVNLKDPDDPKVPDKSTVNCAQSSEGVQEKEHSPDPTEHLSDKKIQEGVKDKVVATDPKSCASKSTQINQPKAVSFSLVTQPKASSASSNLKELHYNVDEAKDYKLLMAMAQAVTGLLWQSIGDKTQVDRILQSKYLLEEFMEQVPPLLELYSQNSTSSKLPLSDELIVHIVGLLSNLLTSSHFREYLMTNTDQEVVPKLIHILGGLLVLKTSHYSTQVVCLALICLNNLAIDNEGYRTLTACEELRKNLQECIYISEDKGKSVFHEQCKLAKALQETLWPEVENEPPAKRNKTDHDHEHIYRPET